MANKYKIKEGVTFRPYGSFTEIKGEQLTDAMAEMFIKKNPFLLGKVIIKNESPELIEVAEVVTKKKRKYTKKSK